MREGSHTVTRRSDYAPAPFWIDTVDLIFDLSPAKTRVLNKMTMRRNPDVVPKPLQLDGQALELVRVLVDGQAANYHIEDEHLVIEDAPEGEDPFVVEIFTTCCPEENSELMGLYMSQGSFFTQCEAQGFRRITYFLDRPDVMSTYTVTLRAVKVAYPVLLSNGNLIEQGDLPLGRHYARWRDPHRKPCYLFAIVAGVLVAREQRITDRAGQEHLLQIYVRPGDLDKTDRAMQALIHAIIWDETRFGLSLDLERFMIVATGDFNMGAMENKGLNIFNTRFVLASPTTATDADYDAIESVIGHEYFHNWTGNRITCRDWFQLSLKEGLTVFRDQEFSMDLAGSSSARAVKRIGDVIVLRTVQFPEDAGPMAHPVRPDEYLEISNFYTATVYEKGAEVVRMMQTLVGREGFRRGMDLYFQRYDGGAVTCDDFVHAVAGANPQSELARWLPEFKRWYSQSGTPVVQALGQYDADTQRYTLTLAQSCPATPGQFSKEPFVIPIKLGLIGKDGEQFELQLAPSENSVGDEMVYVLREQAATLTFYGIPSEPAPSLLRGFSAPVKLSIDTSADTLLTLLAHDPDAFNRWEAGQQLLLQTALHWVNAEDAMPSEPIDDSLLQALRAILKHPQLDAAFKALTLTLPREDYVAEQLASFDPQRIAAVLDAMELHMAYALSSDWEQVWRDCSNNGAYVHEPVADGRRALAGLALRMLCHVATKENTPVWPGRAYQRCKDADNMTDHIAALSALLGAGHPLAQQALDHYYARLHTDPLAIDKWFSLQARAPDRNGSSLNLVRKLMQHPSFTLRNPNRARSLLFGYCVGNQAGFHRADGEGYNFWADRVLEIDSFNPQVAARLARALDAWARLAAPYRKAAKEAIVRVSQATKLSDDVREVVTRALAAESGLGFSGDAENYDRDSE
jgi:aminopeptidase N